MTCRVSGKDAVMKLFLILLAIGLLFVVTGCGGKGNTLNILPKSKRKEKSGWVQGWVKSESIKFNWKEDSLENLIESK